MRHTHLGWKFPMTIQKEAEMHPRIIIHTPPALHFLESVKSTEVVRLLQRPRVMKDFRTEAQRKTTTGLCNRWRANRDAECLHLLTIDCSKTPARVNGIEHTCCNRTSSTPTLTETGYPNQSQARRNGNIRTRSAIIQYRV